MESSTTGMVWENDGYLTTTFEGGEYSLRYITQYNGTRKMNTDVFPKYCKTGVIDQENSSAYLFV